MSNNLPIWSHGFLGLICKFGWKIEYVYGWVWGVKDGILNGEGIWNNLKNNKIDCKNKFNKVNTTASDEQKKPVMIHAEMSY